MSESSGFSLVPPAQSEGSNQALCLDSALQELPLYQFQVEVSLPGSELIQVFEQHPLLPGAVLSRNGQFAGMISRRRFLESLIRPFGLDLFVNHPLEVVYSYARTGLLVLPGATPIVIAAQQALRRSPELQGEPIVVRLGAEEYWLLDVHELNIAYWQIRGIETQVRYERTQAQMIQSDKMANLGRLVDGVAHEVLDPVSFIWGNLTYVSIYTQGLMQLLDAYIEHVPSPPRAILELQEEIELDFLQQDLPRSIESIKAGAERLTKLANSLQNFCHIDAVYPKPADLHESIDSILLLLKSRLTGEIEIVKNYGHLPPVICYIGQLNQVFMNIFSNAVDALADQAVRQTLAAGFGEIDPVPAPKPRIEITTDVRSIKPGSKSDAYDQRWVSIRIANNGPIISPEQQQDILGSFSIAQRATKETSLSASYQIVTAKHGGKLKLRSPCFSEADQETGTEFEILLPLN